MTDADAAVLRQLVDKWRDAAAYEFGDLSNVQYAQGMDACADELDAALAALPQPVPQLPTRLIIKTVLVHVGRFLNLSDATYLEMTETVMQWVNHDLALSLDAVGQRSENPPCPRAPQEMVVPEATVEVCGFADERPEPENP